ncbi:MAG: glycosyltransferase family 2 protein [Oligoflexales bacterium]|nr:glycosyltransferase family 2 protein [Oligoflexales bacterium]
MKLSVVIPAHNEEGSIRSTVEALHSKLDQERIEHEILVVNDNSRDHTEKILRELQSAVPTLRYVNNRPPNGFGYAVRCGLDHFTGDVVAVYMADGSDKPEDLVRYYSTLLCKKVDCVFGTRFHPQSTVVDYPRFKLILNRIFNLFVQMVFMLGYNDITNAFKMYRRHVIDGLKPILSCHFNLTLELPLKSIIRGYSYAVVPNDWINRKTGVSNLRIKEMGSRYMFIVFYCLIEKWLSRGDYRRKDHPVPVKASPAPHPLTGDGAGL